MCGTWHSQGMFGINTVYRTDKEWKWNAVTQDGDLTTGVPVVHFLRLNGLNNFAEQWNTPTEYKELLRTDRKLE